MRMLSRSVPLTCGTLAVCFALAGCGGNAEPESAADDASGTDAGAQEQTAVETESPPPTPDEIWADLVAQARGRLDDDELDSAEETLAELDDVYPAGESPSEEQLAERTGLEDRLADRRRELEQIAAEQRREQLDAKLTAAADLVDAGKLDDATRTIDELLSLGPTDEQRARSAELKQRIETVRTAKRRLGSWMKLLSSTEPAKVRAAQSQLRREPDVALPLLFEALHDAENPGLVKNALELLRQLNRPDEALPRMVGLLSRPEQQENWNDAVAEIGRIGSPGAGPALLDLVGNAESPEQRIAALSALAAVPDPPSDTLLAMLPLVAVDGPGLRPALEASRNAVSAHGQFDFAARRGFDRPLTKVEQAALDALPGRLMDLADLSGDEERERIAHLATVLAVAARQRTVAPFEDVKVFDASAESPPDGLAVTVLDGIWQQTELETMWRYPVAEKGTLILDLGEIRTVTGVRIWNFNQPGGQHRGWKELEVYVSETVSSVAPVAEGIVPPAPGVADPPDYSTTIPVDGVRGRYVKLVEKSVWRPDSYKGLAEVQVLGF